MLKCSSVACNIMSAIVQIKTNYYLQSLSSKGSFDINRCLYTIHLTVMKMGIIYKALTIIHVTL